jgi:aminopeptidase N
MEFLTKGRLTKSIKPLNYYINLFPNFETFKFDGVVQIMVSFDKQYQNIPKFALHSKNLTIHEVKLNLLNVSSFVLDVDSELLIIECFYPTD